MARTTSLNPHSTVDVQSILNEAWRICSDLKAAIYLAAKAEHGCAITDRLQYDIGESDIRPIARTPHTYTERTKQNSLDAMLLRGF
jgi:hypothetical protein